eukprot:scaffold2770_cov104-Cylindrotheca_fusiformis.AAC.5
MRLSHLPFLESCSVCGEIRVTIMILTTIGKQEKETHSLVPICHSFEQAILHFDFVDLREYQRLKRLVLQIPDSQSSDVSNSNVHSAHSCILLEWNLAGRLISHLLHNAGSPH